MAYKTLPPPGLMSRLVRINAKTGLMFWKKRAESDFAHCNNPIKYRDNWNAKYAGKQCFCTQYRGGLGGKIYRVNLYASRVAWCLYYGEWATTGIKHKNGKPNDNRKVNLVDGHNKGTGGRHVLRCIQAIRIPHW